MAGTAAGWRVIIIGPLILVSIVVVLLSVTTVEGRLGDVLQPQLLQEQDDDQPQKHRQLQVTRHTSNATTTTADNVFARAPPPASDGATVNDDDANSTTSRGTDSAVVVVNVKQQQGSSSLCLLNDKGLFGDANTARNSGAQAFELQYLYQLYLAPGTTTTTTTLLNNDVAVDVDRAIVTAILPNFFDCRETSTRRKRLLLLRHNRALQDGGGTIESISALPIDLLVQPRNCKLPH
jgi:hypothetical protein